MEGEDLLLKSVRRAAGLLIDLDYVRIITHCDADGIASAAILSQALRRRDIGFHVSFLKDLRGLDARWWEESEPVVFLDMGSSNLKEIALHGRSLVIDHHVIAASPKTEGFHHVNPNLLEMDGARDASASTLTFLVAREMGDNTDLIPTALAGAIGDRQHVPAFRGINREILELGLSTGHVIERQGLPLYNTTLLESLLFSTDPYLHGISGYEDAVRAFLSEIGIDAEEKVEDLEASPASRFLASRIALRLMKQGATPDSVRCVRMTKFYFPGLGMYGSYLTGLLNAAARSDQPSLGFSSLMGDSSAFEELRKIWQAYRLSIIHGLDTIKDRVIILDGIQYFENDMPNLGGTIGGIALNYLLDDTRPVVALTPDRDLIRISSRGTWHLISRGLNLAKALQDCASEVGGSGGGHPIAAGATIPAEKGGRFIELLDTTVARQICRGEA